jgi:hypothetical protein
VSAFNVDDIIRHPGKPEWGRGRVVGAKDAKIYVFFENISGERAVLLDTTKVKLERLPGERAPLLERLRLKMGTGGYILEKPRVSFDSLFAHFMTECPAGFRDPRLIAEELTYKRAARDAYLASFGEGRAEHLVEAGDGKALAMAFDSVLDAQVNLLSQFERMPFGDAMQITDNAIEFTRGLVAYLSQPPGPESFDRYVAALEKVQATGKQHVRKWPILTLFPFLADPATHMFLKPEVTKEAADIVGVDLSYDPALNWETYSGALALAETVDIELETRGLHPADHIETQSFLWVALKYGNASG